jgi:hypothetical protein
MGGGGGFGRLIGAILGFPLKVDGGSVGSALNGPAVDVAVGLLMGTSVEASDPMVLVGGGIGCEALIRLWPNRSLLEAVTPLPVAS